MQEDVIARKVAEDMKRASWIREMFEKGRRLKAQYGPEAVCDLSLGNPNAEPPEAFFDAVRAVAAEHRPSLHRYMPNAGFDTAREAVAGFLSKEYRVAFSKDDLILTTGAAGGMNVVMHAICNPGDEVILLAPYFSEYRFYVEQAGARVVVVQTDADFQPDVAAIEAALSPKTRAIVLNSPNNPSGAVYTEARLHALTSMLGRHDSPSHPIYLVLDDPYRRILYDLDWCPTPVHAYPRSLIVSSYSKDLSIAGERLGYVAVPPHLPGREAVLGAMTMLNRTLGYVNAPAFMQRTIARCADALCNVGFYRRNRDLLCQALLDFGYDLKVPGGALYAFPKSPMEDDKAFVDVLLKHNILAVPGTGFDRPGHIRLSFCVDRETIERALPGFKAALEEVRGR